MPDNEIYYVTNIYPPVTLSLDENDKNLIVIFDYRIDFTSEIEFQLEHLEGVNFKFKDSFPELRKKFPLRDKKQLPQHLLKSVPRSVRYIEKLRAVLYEV